MTVEEHRRLVGVWRTLMAGVFGVCVGLDMSRPVGNLGLPVVGAMICWIAFEIMAMVTAPDGDEADGDEAAEAKPAYRSITIDYVVTDAREDEIADLIFDGVVGMAERYGFKVDGASGGPTEGAPGSETKFTRQPNGMVLGPGWFDPPKADET